MTMWDFMHDHWPVTGWLFAFAVLAPLITSEHIASRIWPREKR